MDRLKDVLDPTLEELEELEAELEEDPLEDDDELLGFFADHLLA